MTLGKRLLIGGGIAATLLAAAQSPAAAPEQVRLRLQLLPGQSYRIRMTADQTILQTRGKRKISVRHVLGLGYRFNVTGVDPTGIATVKVIYDWALWRERGPGGTIEYDSAQAGTTYSAPNRGFAALPGHGFRMRFTQDGRVTDIADLDALIDLMVKTLELPPGPTRTGAVSALKAQFGPQATREIMEQMLSIYPSRAVAVGETWSRRFQLARGFPHIAENTWTLAGLKDGVALVRNQARLRSNEQTSRLPEGAVQVRYAIKGRQEGTLSIDEETGWTKNGTIRQWLGGTIQLSGKNPPGSKLPPYEKVSWPITISRTIRFTSG
jgi:hypothetical protein